MKIKASGRSAFIVVTGLFVCFAGPLSATTTADGAAGAKSETTKYAKHGSRHWKSYAHRKSGKVASRSSAAGKAAPSDAADDDKDLPAIPPSVANANAQLASADSDTPTSNAAKAMTARANDIVQAAPASPPPAADGQVVSADQLNDVDRALRENPANIKLASAEAPGTTVAQAPSPSATTSSNESSTWDQTSLIGKIFIGFGALLTAASAARMFMA
jgi:hypothetical protein